MHRWLVCILLVPMVGAVPHDDPGAERIEAQWHLDAIGARGLVDRGIDGRGVVVAVLDSGIQHTHPDLASRIWINDGEVPDNDEDDDGNGYVDDVAGWDMCHQAPARDEPGFYHGTFVAGVLGADGRAHDGILGVAPGVTIMDVQVFCDDNEYAPRDEPLDLLAPDAVREGLAYAIDMGADIIVMSLQGWTDQGRPPDEALLGVEEEFERAAQAGILIVGAAGNAGTAGPDSPADRPQVLSVGSDTGCGFRHAFSNHGPDVDIWAPGRALSTTLGGYGWDEGTSFSAPMVAGAAALVMQAESTSALDAGARILDAARPTPEGPALDLRGILDVPADPAPVALHAPATETVGDLHHAQFAAEHAPLLLHVRVPGVGDWCFDHATQDPFQVRPARLPGPVVVAARAHNGVVAGAWANTTLTHDTGLEDTPERPILVVGPRHVEEDQGAPLPAMWAGVALALALLGRRLSR